MKKFKYASWNDNYCDTPLMALDAANIFSIDKLPNGLFRMTEECDQYYDVTLSKKDLLDIARAIRHLALGVNDA